MNFLKKYMPLSWKGWLIFLGAMAGGATVCAFLSQITTSDVHVPMIFVLVVLVISLLTDGYFYGVLAAVVSVFAVNWAFTFPYMKLDFSIYGYPLTFITLLAVGVAASTLMSTPKAWERLRQESEMEKMRANLLRSISHDLRTPLTSISGCISAVLDGENLTEQEKTTLLCSAKEDSEWLYRMVENLLSITRISDDGPDLINRSNELLEEVVGEAVSKFKNRNPEIAVRVSVPEDPLFAPMDPILIEQLLGNLIDNAILHGHADRISVEVTELPDAAQIVVSDNGCGIDRKLLPHLFDASYQMLYVQSGDRNRFIGIGLAVCKTIAEAHSGTISAVNRPDGGAAFTFTIAKGEGNDDYSG